MTEEEEGIEEVEQTVLSRYHAVLSDLDNPKKDKVAQTNKYSYTYTSLPALLDMIRPVLAKHGLAVYQHVMNSDDGLMFFTTLTDGKESFCVDERPYKQLADIQQQGSWETYTRRYALLSVFGISGDDDDGKAAHDAAEQDPLTAEIELTAHALQCSIDDVKAAIKGAGCKTKGAGIGFCTVARELGTLNVNLEGESSEQY